ncbi:MAG: VOC family protein [Microbacterium sp.]
MGVTAIDLQVDDVSAATKLLSEAYGWRVLSRPSTGSGTGGFGELDAGGLRIMLSRDAMVPWGALDGLILHHDVDDVPSAVERAVSAGAELLSGPLTTDWGTEAAYLRGPGALIVDVCRDV